MRITQEFVVVLENPEYLVGQVAFSVIEPQAPILRWEIGKIKNAATLIFRKVDHDVVPGLG